MAHGASEIIGLKSLVTELGFPTIPLHFIIRQIKISSESVIHDRKKHVEVDIHFLCETVQIDFVSRFGVPSRH